MGHGFSSSEFRDKVLNTNDELANRRIYAPTRLLTTLPFEVIVDDIKVYDQDLSAGPDLDTDTVMATPTRQK